MKKTATTLSCALFIAGVLAGCSSGSTSTGPTVTTVPASAAAPAADVDKTAEFKAANTGAPWIDQVTAATETETGRVRIDTTVVDPKGEDGSAPAKKAIAICEAAVASFGPSYTNISVMEQDGTHFVLYGHPSVPKGACTEV